MQTDISLVTSDFYSEYFTPPHGFTTAAGEQAACILDKADHMLQALVCTKKQLEGASPAKHGCYAGWATALMRSIAECCSGMSMAKKWTMTGSLRSQCMAAIQEPYDQIDDKIVQVLGSLHGKFSKADQLGEGTLNLRGFKVLLHDLFIQVSGKLESETSASARV
jgi:hypothetical protein